MEKTLKARKEHKCDACEKVILKNELYLLSKFKVPRFDDDFETQIGIEFIHFKTCQKCFEEIEKDAKEWERFT